jgi:hypothetical protein
MTMMRLLGVFAIIPASLLLTLSFFVLYTTRKPDCKDLKPLGLNAAVLLWISTSLVLGIGFYIITTGRHPMMEMMYGMKGYGKGSSMMNCPMHKEMMRGFQMPCPMKSGPLPQQMQPSMDQK